MGRSYQPQLVQDFFHQEYWMSPNKLLLQFKPPYTLSILFFGYIYYTLATIGWGGHEVLRHPQFLWNIALKRITCTNGPVEVQGVWKPIGFPLCRPARGGGGRLTCYNQVVRTACWIFQINSCTHLHGKLSHWWKHSDWDILNGCTSVWDTACFFKDPTKQKSTLINIGIHQYKATICVK